MKVGRSLLIRDCAVNTGVAAHFVTFTRALTPQNNEKYSNVNHKGQAWLKRRTARKRLRNSLKRVTEWCRQNRHRRIREQVQLLNAKLRGYNNYYGVNGNRASLDEFFYQVRRIHQRWLNQRNQRHSYTWVAYTELTRLLVLEQPRIVPQARRSL